MAAVVAIVVPVLALGCEAGRATKAGKATGPVVLRMASRDSDQGLYDPAAAYFVSRVGQLSSGQLRIVVSDWGSKDPAVEQQIVRAVAAGKVDLGAAGTRVFDTLGVASFQALTAPMLIDSYPLERKVIASDIPEKMLDGLDTLGVTGLAVLGEGLRKPVAVNRLLLGPSDWHGITFAAFRSRDAAATIRALGARPSDLVGGTLTEALGRRRVQGAENDFLTYQNNDRQTLAPYVTANVNLWPRTEALLANPHRLSRLTHEQQSWLRQAAADTAARSTSLFDHDRQIAAFLCKTGAHLANASHSQLVALRTVLAPVYARLEANAETKAFIVGIQQLKRSTPGRPPSLPPTCNGSAGTEVNRANARVVPHAARSMLNGTYRFTISDADLETHGVTGRGDIRENHGLATWVLHDGDFHWHQRATNRLFHPDGEGTYAVAGDRITFVFPGGPPPLTLRWSRSGGKLRFAALGGGNRVVRTLFTAHPWKKIG